MYTGVLQCFMAIYREGGFRRLYRGIGPSLLGIVPYAGIDLAVFETLKEAYIQRIMLPKQQQQQLLLLQQQLQQQGGCSGCSPNLSSPPVATPAAAASPVPAVEAAAAAPASRVRWTCDEGSTASSGSIPMSPPAVALLLMGGCSSLIGQVVAYPTALIRTRMQVDGSGGQQLLYRNSAAAAAAAIKQGGFRGLYRGLGANCCKALPAVSLSWIAYEKTKEAIRRLESEWTERITRQRHVADAPAAVGTTRA